MTTYATGPLPTETPRLYIPSILVNPKSKEQAARESYIAQQREHGLAQARKRQDDKVGKVGKRRERRRENAMLAHNPHAALPSRIDLMPSAPKYISTFPHPSSRSPAAAAIRTAAVPSPAAPVSEPMSTEAGKYTLSLKGVRSMLRKRGRRAEVVVKIVEKELRGWSGCELDDDEIAATLQGTLIQDLNGFGQPRIIDTSLVHIKCTQTANTSKANAPLAEAVSQSQQEDLLAGSSASNPRNRLPRPFTTHPASSPHSLSSLLTSIYTSSMSGSYDMTTQRQAIIELVRAPGHLVWAIADGWERLIVHLLVRYYGLISFSQTLPPTPTNHDDFTAAYNWSPAYRITHILQPSALHTPALSSRLQLMTPDNSELDTDFATGSEAGFATTSDSEVASSRLEESDTETECGSSRGKVKSAARRASFLPDSASFDHGHDVESDIEGDTTLVPLESSQGLPATLRRKRRSESKPSGDARPTKVEDDGDESYGEASDEEGYAESTSSLLDSMMLSATITQPGEGPRPSESVAPFASEFDIPLHIDLFPERRSKLDNERATQRRGKTPFFEYLYG